MSTEVVLAAITVLATLTTTAVFSYDVYRRNKSRRMAYAKVPSGNQGGFIEYSVIKDNLQARISANKITLNYDKSIEIETDKEILIFTEFINCKDKI